MDRFAAGVRGERTQEDAALLGDPGRNEVSAIDPASGAALPAGASDALRRYVLHRGASEPADALRAASDACHEAPQSAQCHYAYGEAWLAFGQAKNAARAFAEAVRLAPSWADAWVNLGICRYREGAVGDAKLAMRQALRHAPGHAAAGANLAAFMRISGEGAAAELLLQDALATEPGNHAARLNLAADRLQEERPADALALLDESAALPDDLPLRRHWLLQRCLALTQLDRLDEARAVLDSLTAQGPLPPQIAPLWRWRRVLLARASGAADIAAEEARAMEAALGSMGPTAVPEHRIMAHYDLAKFWSERHEHAAAFAHWQTGHALLRPSQPFSRDAHREFIDASMTVFDRARLRLHASNRDAAPVFIVGMPRSGTTLCERILAAHPQVHGAGERAALGNLFRELGHAEDSAAGVERLATLGPVALDAAAADYLSQLHALAPDKSRIIDKMPANYLYLGLAALLFPAARYIHCVRDPRDIGLSIFTFRFHGAHGYAHDLGDLGFTIAQQMRLMAHWKKVLARRVLVVALADWVEDFAGTLARVLAHLNLPYEAACERFFDTTERVRTVSRAQVRQPVNAHGLDRWRPYEQQLKPLIEELERGGCLQPPRRRGATRRQATNNQPID